MMMMMMVEYLLLSLAICGIVGAGPVFLETTYTVTLGINTSIDTVLATLNYTFPDANEVVTFSMDPTLDGYSYFGFSGDDVILATGLDVEYGGTTWTARILAIDNGSTPETASATLSLITYDSTTTTTTTPAPPGYSWFDQQENVILFGSFFAFMALLSGICVLMCFRFHRIGTCLPRNCPEYRQCRASARRQCSCCVLPCTFNDHSPLEKDDTFVFSEREKSNASLPKTAVAPEPLPPPIVVSKKGDGNASRQASVQSPTRSVTPVVMGNVDLRDVGFDGMMSPGFNAPMFTSYGGSSDATGTGNKKRRRKRPL